MEAVATGGFALMQERVRDFEVLEVFAVHGSFEHVQTNKLSIKSKHVSPPYSKLIAFILLTHHWKSR